MVSETGGVEGVVLFLEEDPPRDVDGFDDFVEEALVVARLGVFFGALLPAADFLVDVEGVVFLLEEDLAEEVDAPALAGVLFGFVVLAFFVDGVVDFDTDVLGDDAALAEVDFLAAPDGFDEGALDAEPDFPDVFLVAMMLVALSVGGQ